MSGTGSQEQAGQGEFEIVGVDDDKVQHLVLRKLMVSSGYRYHQCLSSEECLEMLHQRKSEGGIESFPTVVLMDIMMPGLSGLDCTRKIRDLYQDSPLPVIMVTTMEEEEGMCEGIEAGCNDYIHKPFDSKTLLSRIRVQINLLQRIKQRQQQQ